MKELKKNPITGAFEMNDVDESLNKESVQTDRNWWIYLLVGVAICIPMFIAYWIYGPFWMYIAK